jgi:hypothetical protein
MGVRREDRMTVSVGDFVRTALRPLGIAEAIVGVEARLGWVAELPSSSDWEKF